MEFFSTRNAFSQCLLYHANVFNYVTTSFSTGNQMRIPGEMRARDFCCFKFISNSGGRTRDASVQMNPGSHCRSECCNKSSVIRVSFNKIINPKTSTYQNTSEDN